MERTTRFFHSSKMEAPTETKTHSKTGEKEALDKYSISFGLSVAITSVLSALLVVIKELNENTVLAWMKHVTPHHWITHGIIDLIVFAVVGFALAHANGGKGLEVSSKALVELIAGAVIISCVIIAGFYLVL